jgi:hypothetical protein
LTLPGLEPTIYRSRDEHVWWRSNINNTIVIDFDLTLPGLEPTIYRSRDEHAWWRSNSINTIDIDFKVYNKGIIIVTSSLNMLVSRTVDREFELW